ncbi:hypothetical protein Tco_1483157 [Tanacetum coccineum]
MEVTKSGLKQWKEKFFLIDRRAIPFHMPWRHPDSCITDKVPTGFNQNHVDRLKAHIVKLCDIPEGVLVRSGLSRVWRNLMCDPVLRRSNNTVMSIHDFLCMPSLEKATVREEPHELGTSILGRVADRTTPPAPAGTAIPLASPEEIAITRPDPKQVSGASSSGLAAGDGVEQTDDGTLDDDGQRDGLEFAMEDTGNLNDVRQGEHINVIPLRTFDPSLGLDVTYPPILLPDKEVEAHAEVSEGVRRTTRASSHVSLGVSEDASSPTQEAVPAPDTQPLDTDAGADDIASDGNVDSYFDEVSGSETALDRFPTLAETHRLRELSSVELSDRMSRRTQQTQIIKNESVGLKQQKDSTVRANEEVSRLKAELGALKSKCEATKHKLNSWDKRHRKYRNERDALALKNEKIEDELEVAGFIPDAKEKFDRVIAAFPDTTFPDTFFLTFLYYCVLEDQHPCATLYFIIRDFWSY